MYCLFICVGWISLFFCLWFKHFSARQVDAHNVVPCWVASPKLEYAARTIRGKITKVLSDFLTDFPPVEKHPYTATRTAKVSAAVTAKGTERLLWIKVNALLSEEERSHAFVFMSHSRTFGWVCVWGGDTHNLSSPKNIHCFWKCFLRSIQGKDGCQWAHSGVGFGSHTAAITHLLSTFSRSVSPYYLLMS